MPLVLLAIILCGVLWRFVRAESRKIIGEVALAAIALWALLVGSPLEPWKVWAAFGIAIIATFTIISGVIAAKEAPNQTRQIVREELERFGRSSDPLLRKASTLVLELSEIFDPFYERESGLALQLQAAKELGRESQAIDLRIQLASIENVTMQKYRQGGYAERIRDVVSDFARAKIHDDFMDNFVAIGASEPYRIRQYRDSISNMLTRYAIR